MWRKWSKNNLTTLPSVKMMKNANNAIIGLIRPVFLHFYDTINVDLTFSRIKLSLTFEWEKVITLRLLLTPREWRAILVCPHSILVSFIIHYTNMAATNQLKLGILKSKVNFFAELRHFHDDKKSAVLDYFNKMN